MMGVVRLIATGPVAAGLGLAGLPVVEVTDAATGAVRLAEWLDQPEVGVILVEERVHAGLPEELRTRMAQQAIPLVVPFPGPVWVARREAAEAYVVELLRRAIGYRVKLT